MQLLRMQGVAGEGQKMKQLVHEFYRRIVLGIAIVVGIVALIAQSGSADRIPAGWKASNMKPIGYSDLDGRGGAFKIAIRHVNNHWYLYMGHLWHRGWSIVDVTDPANPKLAKFVPGPDNTWTIQMELHDDIMLTPVAKIQPGWGGDPNKPFEEGVLIWDISDPVNPKQLSHWKTGVQGAPSRSLPGREVCQIVAAMMPGYKGQILVILDISDPKNPKEAGRWWEPGQRKANRRLNRASGGLPWAGVHRRKQGVSRLWVDPHDPRHQRLIAARR